jgi:glycosyltransferase involved in cell wall biosynthesis
MTNKPKVVHVIDHLGVGGAQRTVKDQINYRDRHVVFILRQKHPFLEPEIPEESIIFQGKGIIDLLFVGLPKLLRHQRQNRRPILHAHLIVSWWLCFFIGVLSGRQQKVLFHEHGWIAFNKPLYRWLIKRCVNHGKIVSVSNYIRDLIMGVGIPASRVEVIYNGLNPDVFFPDAQRGKAWRIEHDIAETDFVIGFSGRLEAHKGWRDFLQMMEAVNHQQNIKGLLVGVGPDGQRIKRYIFDNGLEKNVFLLHYTSDMLSFYNGLDVLVFPSHIEPLGRVHLEAQACGIPVVVTAIPGLIETVDEKCAILVEPHRPDLLANAVLSIMNDNRLKESLVKAGKKNVEKRALKVFLAEFDRVYNELSKEKF